MINFSCILLMIKSLTVFYLKLYYKLFVKFYEVIPQCFGNILFSRSESILLNTAMFE